MICVALWSLRAVRLEIWGSGEKAKVRGSVVSQYLPVLHSGEGLLVGNVIHEQEAHGSSVVCCGDRTVALLARCVLGKLQGQPARSHPVPHPTPAEPCLRKALPCACSPGPTGKTWTGLYMLWPDGRNMDLPAVSSLNVEIQACLHDLQSDGRDKVLPLRSSQSEESVASHRLKSLFDLMSKNQLNEHKQPAGSEDIFLMQTPWCLFP